MKETTIVCILITLVIITASSGCIESIRNLDFFPGGGDDGDDTTPGTTIDYDTFGWDEFSQTVNGEGRNGYLIWSDDVYNRYEGDVESIVVNFKTEYTTSLKAAIYVSGGLLGETEEKTIVATDDFQAVTLALKSSRPVTVGTRYDLVFIFDPYGEIAWQSDTGYTYNVIFQDYATAFPARLTGAETSHTNRALQTYCNVNTG